MIKLSFDVRCLKIKPEENRCETKHCIASYYQSLLNGL